MEIYKVVTSRKTSFIVGHEKEWEDDSPVVTKIELVNSEEPGTFACHVYFSDNDKVFVSDVVEVWNKQIAP